MYRMKNRLLALLLALLTAFAFLPAAMAAEEPSEIELLGQALLTSQTEYDSTLAYYNEIAADLEELNARYERNENDVALQDKLLEKMIEEEDAAALLAVREKALLSLQEQQTQLQLLDECEPCLVEDYRTKYAGKLNAEVIVNEDMTIYGLTVTLSGGGERDQAACENAFLYQFIGKTLPLTIGDKKTDDIPSLDNAPQTGKDVVAALNTLVAAEPAEKKPAGPLIEPQDIADYIFEHGELPENFITKKEAQKLGWDSSWNYVSDVAPGKSIGGDHFGNYEGRLPDKKGRTWYEADCYYTKGKRNAHRILFSNDGLVYYTDDHYETFTQMFPSGK